MRWVSPIGIVAACAISASVGSLFTAVGITAASFQPDAHVAVDAPAAIVKPEQNSRLSPYMLRQLRYRVASEIRMRTGQR